MRTFITNNSKSFRLANIGQKTTKFLELIKKKNKLISLRISIKEQLIKIIDEFTQK